MIEIDVYDLYNQFSFKRMGPGRAVTMPFCFRFRISKMKVAIYLLRLRKRAMKQLIYDPSKSGRRMTIACFISGSGTNYREIVKAGPDHRYVVFTNRPECKGLDIARENRHEIIELSHIPFLKEARKKYGPGNVPRNCPERIAYEQEAVRLIENRIGSQPDLICMAGYDQWNTDWFVDRYYPRIANTHPGDTTRDYAGLHWVPAAKAILAGDTVLRSTLFFVDKSQDKGPVLVQSRALDINQALSEVEQEQHRVLTQGLNEIKRYARENLITSYADFKQKASAVLYKTLEQICSLLQERLKEEGDWKIYPLAVHEFIARGRVAIDGRKVYLDGRHLPEYGFRLDER
jgi:folate-dependent phosphoribosylglycinamide formyltransferase PurN